MSTTTLTIRIDEETKRKLEHLAEATARSKTYLVTSAIKGFIEANDWQVRAIKKAVANADKPDAKFIAHEDVVAWLDTWGTKKEKKRPK